MFSEYGKPERSFHQRKNAAKRPTDKTEQNSHSTNEHFAGRWQTEIIKVTKTANAFYTQNTVRHIKNNQGVPPALLYNWFWLGRGRAIRYIFCSAEAPQKDAASIPHALKISKASTLQSLRRLYLFFVETAVCKGWKLLEMNRNFNPYIEFVYEIKIFFSFPSKKIK